MASMFEGKKKVQLLTAILSTVAAALFGASAVISPSPLKVLGVIVFAVASTLNWVAYAKPGTPIGKQEKPGQQDS